MNLYPHTVVLTLALLFVEAFTYDGFIAKHLFISTNFLLFLTVTLGLLLMRIHLYNKTLNKQTYFLVLDLNSLLFPPLLLIMLLARVIELTHYPNYLYSTYHIQPEGFDRIVLITSLLVVLRIGYKNNSFQVFFTSLFDSVKSKYGVKRTVELIFPIKAIKIHYVMALTLVALLIISLLDGILYTTNNFVQIVGEISHFNNQTQLGKYEYKMNQNFGMFYQYSKIINELIPADASLLIPPQTSPWLYEGNNRVMSSLLFPRKVVSFSEDANQQKLIKEMDFIIVTPGSALFSGDANQLHPWPEFEVPIEGYYVFDIQNGSYRINDHDYNYSDYDGSFGLIKIQK